MNIHSQIRVNIGKNKIFQITTERENQRRVRSLINKISNFLIGTRTKYTFLFLSIYLERKNVIETGKDNASSGQTSKLYTHFNLIYISAK